MRASPVTPEDIDHRNVRTGPFYSPQAIIDGLGVTSEALEAMVVNREILKVITADGVSVYPAYQMVMGPSESASIHPGITRYHRILLDAGQDPWTAIYWMTSASEATRFRKPHHILTQGSPSEVAELDVLLASESLNWFEHLQL